MIKSDLSPKIWAFPMLKSLNFAHCSYMIKSCLIHSYKFCEILKYSSTRVKHLYFNESSAKGSISWGCKSAPCCRVLIDSCAQYFNVSPLTNGTPCASYLADFYDFDSSSKSKAKSWTSFLSHPKVLIVDSPFNLTKF